jgi:hypothetical protein
MLTYPGLQPVGGRLLPRVGSSLTLSPRPVTARCPDREQEAQQALTALSARPEPAVVAAMPPFVSQLAPMRRVVSAPAEVPTLTTHHYHHPLPQPHSSPETSSHFSTVSRRQTRRSSEALPGSVRTGENSDKEDEGEEVAVGSADGNGVHASMHSSMASRRQSYRSAGSRATDTQEGAAAGLDADKEEGEMMVVHLTPKPTHGVLMGGGVGGATPPLSRSSRRATTHTNRASTSEMFAGSTSDTPSSAGRLPSIRCGLRSYTLSSSSGDHEQGFTHTPTASPGQGGRSPAQKTLVPRLAMRSSDSSYTAMDSDGGGSAEVIIIRVLCVDDVGITGGCSIVH